MDLLKDSMLVSFTLLYATSCSAKAITTSQSSRLSLRLVARLVHPGFFHIPTQALAIRIRSLIPLIYIALDPVPIEYNVVGGGSVKFILTKEAAGSAIFTIAPIEDIWDSMFTEAFTRLLASALAFALENRIEASKEKLSEALNFAGIANLRDS
jgi:hypothetical protein